MEQAESAREAYFTRLRRWLEIRREETQKKFAEAERRWRSFYDSLPNFANEEKRARSERDELEAQLAWFDTALRAEKARDRTMLAHAPTWSFAGNLQKVASTIEECVSRTVAGIGSKDDRPFVYVSNPPRHGKSLLLDTLFRNNTSVCVLCVTYNAATHIHPTELKSAEGALCGFFTRLLNDFVFGYTAWEDALEGSPFRDVPSPQRIFRDMLELLRPQAPLLICIDEISKLLDDPNNEWKVRIEDQKLFWRGLYSITGAMTNWIRVVMTGFTDAPEKAVAASDVGCLPYQLSLITNAECELLAAELLWAHAATNVRFPAFLWALVKSTPGLLGVWAQQIALGKDNGPFPKQAMNLHDDLSGAAQMVPWVKVLIDNAERNWAVICRFMEEETPNCCPSETTRREARNMEVATMLEGKVVLSPFAVAVTVLALRDSRPFEGGALFNFLYQALCACTKYSAGCAEYVRPSWPVNVQNLLRKRRLSSSFLDSDARLKRGGPILNYPQPDCLAGAVVHTLGLPFENFVLHALALRLECARIQGKGVVRYGDLLPPCVGDLAGVNTRTPMAVSFTSNPQLDLVRLCTQTAVLLLPSSINNILGSPVEEFISRRKYLQPTERNFDSIRFRFDVVRVLTDDSVPKTFPVVDTPKTRNSHIHCILANELASPYFDPETFRKAHRANFLEVCGVEEDVFKVVELASGAIDRSEAVAFKPSNIVNPLCDVVVVLPCLDQRDGLPEVCFLFVELKDTHAAGVEKKLELARRRELLLYPVSNHLLARGIRVCNVLVCCARNAINVKE